MADDGRLDLPQSGGHFGQLGEEGQGGRIVAEEQHPLIWLQSRESPSHRLQVFASQGLPGGMFFQWGFA